MADVEPVRAGATLEAQIAQRLAAPPPVWRENPKAGPYVPLIEAAAAQNGVPPELLGALVERESQFDPAAVSPAGAVGLAQLMPIHAPMVNRQDPKASLAYSAKYLHHLKERFGDWDAALASYNWGPANVRKAKFRYKEQWLENAPPETRAYVQALKGTLTASDTGY